MAERADPVRRTIDTLQVDPAAREDRPYLETMLRRLGYSEAEIRRALGDPQPAPDVTETAPQMLTDDRVIEIEYTGPGLRDFILVEPADETEFAMDGDPLGLGAGLTAGEEVLGGGPSMDEVDALVAGASEDDWNDWGDSPGGAGSEPKEDIAESKIGAEDNPFEEGAEGPALETADGPSEAGDAASTDPLATTEGAPPEGEGEMVDFGAPAAAEPPAEEYQVGTEIEFIQGHELVEFEDLGLNKGRVLTPPSPEQLAAEEAERAHREAAEAAARADPGQVSEAWQQAGPATPFRHEDWTLYTRDVELSDGTPQKVYFFSKGVPKTGDAAPMPEGYEVAVNDRTGLPYLRRVSPEAPPEGTHPSELDQLAPGADPSGAPGRKRVRMVRVRGASREEAERKVVQSGKDRNVIRSVPIDIKGGGGVE